MSTRSRRLRKALLMTPTAAILVLVLAGILPELAMVVAPFFLLPLALFSARQETAELERLPVVPIGAPAQLGDVVGYRSLPSSLLAAFLPAAACIFAAWVLAVEFERGWIGSLALLVVAGLVLRRCLAVSVELRWDEVVVRNLIRTYRVPWRDVERVFLDGEGQIAFARRGSRLATAAQATQLRLRREFVRELRRFAAAHDHVVVDIELERKRS